MWSSNQLLINERYETLAPLYKELEENRNEDIAPVNEMHSLRINELQQRIKTLTAQIDDNEGYFEATKRMLVNWPKASRMEMLSDGMHRYSVHVPALEAKTGQSWIGKSTLLRYCVSSSVIRTEQHHIK